MSELSDDELLRMIETPIAASGEMTKVEGSSGTDFHVYGVEEAVWFTTNLERYMQDYRFENIADLQDLDRLLGMELLSYRYTRWLLQEKDYDGMKIDEKGTREHKEKVDKEIRLLKKSMGMSRQGRMESESESTGDFLRNLLRRAEEFGIHRDHQISKAFDLLMELKKLVGLHDRSDEEERMHLGVNDDQIIDWIREVAIKEFDKIDEAFRKNQRLWIREVS